MAIIIPRHSTKLSRHKTIKSHRMLGGAIQKECIGDIEVPIDDSKSNLANLKSALREIRIGKPRRSGPADAQEEVVSSKKKKYIHF